MELSFKLEKFEGPLDLLLHLLDKSQIAIEDIFVSDITEQYLEYIGSLPELNMDSASEFLATAAMLLEIKSRRLLPKPPKPEEEQEDPEQTLIRRLREYKEIKENAKGRSTFYKRILHWPGIRVARAALPRGPCGSGSSA